MFSSKLNPFKFQTNFNTAPETKLQKYLRLRNEKLLDKCFNIKTEKVVVNKNESHNDKETISTQILPRQQNTPKELWQPNNDIPRTATDSDEIELKDSTLQPVKQNTMEVSKANSCFDKFNPKKRPQTGDSKHNSGSKSSRSLQTTRTSSASNWKSPFSSLTTSGTRNRILRKQQASEFAYDLSREELKFIGKFCGPMKLPSENERQLLRNGARKDYLNQRYEHSPAMKYNYPEATSWRIGWLQH